MQQCLLAGNEECLVPTRSLQSVHDCMTQMWNVEIDKHFISIVLFIWTKQKMIA